MEIEKTKFVFFDIGYTLINEDDVWEKRCREQAQADEAISLGLTSENIYDEIVLATKTYQPQYRTVVNKYNFTWQAPYDHALEKLYDDAENVLQLLSQK